MTAIIPSQVHFQTISYNQIDFVGDIPANFILCELHRQGADQFNNVDTADLELRVEGLSTSFWVHKEYLILQSTYFREKIIRNNNNGLIVIDIPSPENFVPLLEYLYTGDSDKWYDTMDLGNYDDVWKNVQWLGLGIEAISICNAYWQNVVIPLEEGY